MKFATFLVIRQILGDLDMVVEHACRVVLFACMQSLVVFVFSCTFGGVSPSYALYPSCIDGCLSRFSLFPFLLVFGREPPAHFFFPSSIFYRWPPVISSMCRMKEKKKRRKEKTTVL